MYTSLEMTSDGGDEGPWIFKAFYYPSFPSTNPVQFRLDTGLMTSIVPADLTPYPDSDAWLASGAPEPLREKAARLAEARYTQYRANSERALYWTATGRATLPAATAGVVADIPVTLLPQMPDADYFVSAPVLGGTAAQVAALLILGVTQRTRDGVSVRVRALATLTAGAVIEVIGVKSLTQR